MWQILTSLSGSTYIYIAVVVLVLGLSGTIAYQRQEIKAKDAKIETLTMQIKVLGDDIERQNKAIEDSAKHTAELSKTLDAVYKINKALNIKLSDYKKELDSRPLAQTCDAAISELINESMKVGKEWNSAN